MIKTDDEFFNKLLSTFKIEADEHIQNIYSGILEFKKNPDKFEIIENVFREAHSLKGAARAVGIHDIEIICQNIENIFSAFKKKEISPKDNLLDLITSALELIETQVQKVETHSIKKENQEILSFSKKLSFALKSEKDNLIISDLSLSNAKIDVQPTVEKQEENISNYPIHQIPETKDEETTIQKKETKEKSFTQSTVRVDISKLDSLFLQIEELLAVKLSYNQNIEQSKILTSLLNALIAELNKLEKIFNTDHTHDELFDNLKLITSELINNFAFHSKSLVQNNRSISSHIDSLLENAKEILTLPFSSINGLLNKMTHELSKDLNKSVDILFNGGDFDIDRRILEEIKDPLIHLIRNSIDHGMESRSERLKNKKSPEGRIIISISQIENNRVEIIFEDDGKGIDYNEVKNTALKKGLIENPEITEVELNNLLFKSDFSTSKTITDISGRGLGLAIVQEKIEKLNGSIELKSTKNVGTKFTIILPMSIATSRGIIIRCAGQLFIIPTNKVDKVELIKKEQIQTVENKETITFLNKTIPIVKLSEILELNATSNNNILPVVILSSLDSKIAFVVDEIISEQEYLIKPFNNQLKRIRNILGATILGSGEIILILNTSDLIKSIEKSKEKIIGAEITKSKDEASQKSILVVDDSITSRMLLKDILETSGYKVKTAMDGIEALTQLKTDNFNLVVSDVEMPRMNGFELTRKIKENSKFTNIPVVLITALAKNEDREKGIDAGANAYIVKSSFDQTNLLEIIKRFI